MKIEELAERLRAAALGQSPERKFCVVGPNGAGKTRLLETLKVLTRDANGQHPSLDINANREAVRSLVLPAARGLIQTFGGQTGIAEPIKEFPDPLTVVSLAQFTAGTLHTMRTFQESGCGQLLKSIQAQDNVNQAQYREELLIWAQEDNCLNIPKPQKPVSVRHSVLKMLSEIVKRTIVHRDDFKGTVDIGDEFGIQLDSRVASLDEMSDGEKQSFLLGIFLITRDVNRFVFLIDEPELHLNESRSNEIWGAIENHLKRSVFLYATHSMSFATRDAIDILISIDMNGNLSQIENHSPMPPLLMQEMVGARIQILRSRLPVVFCEDAFTKAVLADVTAGLELDIVSLTGRSAVIDASRQQAGWGHIVPAQIPACGVIDLDELCPQEIEAFEKRNIIVLPFNEIESLLIEHDVFLAVALRYNPTHAGLEAAYADTVANATRSLAKLAIKKHALRLCRHWSPSVNVDHTPEEIKDVVIGSADDLANEIRDISSYILKSRSTLDFGAINRLYPGKEMYQQFYTQSQNRFGFALQSDAATQYRIIRTDSHLLEQLMNVPKIAEIRSKIRSNLQL